MEQVHLLIKNAKVFNSYLKKFISANVAVKDGKFYYIDRKQDTDLQTDNVIEAEDLHTVFCCQLGNICISERSSLDRKKKVDRQCFRLDLT